MVWSDPLPYDPRTFYERDYRLEYKGTYIPKPKHILRAGKLALTRRRAVARWLSAPRVVLDIGAGGGEFLYLLQKLGHTVRGIEPNRGYANYATTEYGLQLYVGFAQEAVFPEGHFDLVTMWHVLEHMACPGEVLRRVWAWLKPGGILAIEVPNIEATCQAPHSTFHEAHLFNFNPATLQKLAEKVGLTRVAQTEADDGGNITLVVQKNPSKERSEMELCIPGNAERIFRLVKGHTILKHYLTATPYRRLLRRLRQFVVEQYGVRHFSGGKALLDRLYAQDLDAVAACPSLAETSGDAPSAHAN
ncbi:MAG: class I SAM-dependent methyltransferase [Acidobacteriota bacterium]